MADDRESDRLKALEDRIARAKGTQEPEPRTDKDYSQAQLAWRMVTELVAGLMIGFGIGYGLDAVFGTTPVLMVIFLLLGFAAGVKVMLRSAAEMSAKQGADQAETGEAGRTERD